MNIQTPKPPRRHHQWLRLILEKILPRGVRKRLLLDLKERGAQGSPFSGLITESGAMVVETYRSRAVRAFNKYAFLAEIGLIIVCFAGAALPEATAFALGTILVTLTLRDAYTHDEKNSDGTGFCLDSAGDAATAGLFLLVAETLALKVSPSLAFPSPVLYRGAMVLLPLIATLRMVWRSRPDPEAPFAGSKLPAEKLYKGTWRLNILWMGAFNGLIMQNHSDVPNSFADFLRGALPGFTFMVWYLLQRDALDRRDNFLGLRTLWKIKEMFQKKEKLAQGIEKGQPFYWWYRALEGLIFLQLAAALAHIVWPWLSGQAPGEGFLRSGFSLVAFATIAVTWKYVKNSNRAAARAFQKEIVAALETAPLV